MPGKMVQCLKNVETANPLVLIDEIDKVLFSCLLISDSMSMVLDKWSHNLFAVLWLFLNYEYYDFFVMAVGQRTCW